MARGAMMRFFHSFTREDLERAYQEHQEACEGGDEDACNWIAEYDTGVARVQEAQAGSIWPWVAGIGGAFAALAGIAWALSRPPLRPALTGVRFLTRRTRR